MKLLFKQRMFSWFGRYDIYDEQGETVFEVEGRPAWGHRLEIFDASGNQVGEIREKLFRLLPSFEVYANGEYIGEIQKRWSFFKPLYTTTFNDWSVKGSFLEWDYEVINGRGDVVMSASKELMRWTDTYAIDFPNPEHALLAAMIVLVIDADKASRDSHNG